MTVVGTEIVEIEEETVNIHVAAIGGDQGLRMVGEEKEM